MKVGYVRVSTYEQNEDLQVDALKKAGCERFFSDTMSGAKINRKGLDEALGFMRNGDTLVVWKLDRLGRSVIDLIHIILDFEKRGIEFMTLTQEIDTTTPIGRCLFYVSAAFAEYERELIRERTKAGLAAARARGHKGGRPHALTKEQVQQLQTLYADKNNTIRGICKTLGVSRATLYRYVEVPKQAE